MAALFPSFISLIWQVQRDKRKLKPRYVLDNKHPDPLISIFTVGTNMRINTLVISPVNDYFTEYAKKIKFICRLTKE